MSSPSETVEAFIETARSFCDLVEQVETQSRETVLDRLAVLLPRLLELAVQLPSEQSAEDVEPPGTSYGAWQARFVAIGQTLGDVGEYWTSVDVGGDRQPEVVNLPVADDLADIWSDLRDGLSLLDGAGSVVDAVWEWRFSFDIHWGAHAVEALRAVHAARTSARRSTGTSGG